VRRHIKELWENHTLYGLKSLDLVVMFVPLEPAFAAAIAADASLWEEGLKRNVLLVSPSSLLFVLRTVAYLWRQEAQARNVQEIARCGADLYDKFVTFVEDVKDLGHHLQKAQASYENTSKKLSEGRGNLISRADKLKKLGVSPKKLLPPELVEIALEEPITIYAAADEEVELPADEEPSPLILK
jgi:DNA recombination protein RmuC